MDGIKDYTCKCTDGYEGKDCNSKYALDNILWCYRGLIEDTLHSFCFLILKIVRRNTALFDIPIIWSHFMKQNGKVISEKSTINTSHHHASASLHTASSEQASTPVDTSHHA